MPILILFFLVIVSLLLQSTVFNIFSLMEVKPDLVLIWVIFFSLFGGKYKGASFGILAGLLEDLLVGRFIGMNVLAKGLTGYIIGLMEAKIYKENILVPIIAVFIGTLMNNFLYYLIGKSIGLSITWSICLRIGISVAIYNSCIVPLFYKTFYDSITNGKMKELL